MSRTVRSIVFLVMVVFIAALLVWGSTVGLITYASLSPGSIQKEEGNTYIASLRRYPWPVIVLSDSLEHPKRAKTQLFEDGQDLGPRHTSHNTIRATGGGAFSHWGDHLWFSTPDNSDPRSNGRKYGVRTTLRLDWRFVLAVFLSLEFTAGLRISKRIAQSSRRVRENSVRTLHSIRQRMPSGREVSYCMLSALVTAFSFYLTMKLKNVNFWLAAAVALIGGILVLGCFTRFLLSIYWRPVSLKPFVKVAVVTGSMMAAVICVEAWLEWREQVPLVVNKNQGVQGGAPELPPEIASALAFPPQSAGHAAPVSSLPLAPEAAENIARRRGVLTLPPEWERRFVTVPGATVAEVWHGVLHLYDDNGFRRASPFPPKRPDVFRLMVVGDSMTYGYGVDEKFIYATLLQNVLGEKFNIEVLNLGKTGWQSEDILNVLCQFLPILKPDLVFYGVVHNDFLPSGRGQETRDIAYAFPLPEKAKAFMLERSRFSRFLSDAYDAALRTANLRADFFDDILRDFEGYQKRFGQDVAEMNRFVTANGLPPVIAMVLDQFVAYGGRGYKITQIAEHYLKQAGMDVIELEDYYRRFDGKAFRVSRWEGHADEEGHAIFASRIIPRLEKHPALQPYQKTLPTVP
jgi:hypothetical protein